MSYAKKSSTVVKNTFKNSFSVFEDSDDEDNFVTVTKKVTKSKSEKSVKPLKSEKHVKDEKKVYSKPPLPPKKDSFQDSFKPLAHVPDRKQQLPTVSYASMLNKPKPIVAQISIKKSDPDAPVLSNKILNYQKFLINCRKLREGADWGDISDDEYDDYYEYDD